VKCRSSNSEHLNAVAADRGWTVTKVFIDRPTTVRKGKERRPGDAALLDALHGGGVQKVLIFGIDRVGRSLDELVRFLETCRVADASVYYCWQIGIGRDGLLRG
jgi:DNA invertase Pin-like site-specific DNA recombinase